MKKENKEIILAILIVATLILGIVFFSTQQFVVIELNKRWTEYPCYYDTKNTKWCGGGMDAIEKMLDKLNKGEWRVDFREVLTT